MKVSQSISNRVDDLIKRMSSNEKISQLQDNSPGIEHLGVKPYLQRNEALHGVKANTGPPEASAMLANPDNEYFLKSIGLASTWNPELVYKGSCCNIRWAEALANRIDNYRYLNFGAL